MNETVAVSLWARGRGSVSYNYSLNGTASVETDYFFGAQAFVSSQQLGSIVNVRTREPGSNSDSGSVENDVQLNLSCASNAIGAQCQTFVDYPGEIYCRVPNFQDIRASVGISHSSSGVHTKSVSANATFNISATLGDSDPSAILSNPIVDGVEIIAPNIGDEITLNNLSYDSDDNLGSTPGEGICSSIWQVTDPTGNVIAGSDIGNPNFNAGIAGVYKVQLTVIDNEGVEVTESKNIRVGLTKRCIPQFEPNQIGACSDSKTSVAIDPFCGEINITSHDPTKTRGYPLRNEIVIRSQTSTSSTSNYMGNAFFTYGMEVSSGTLIDGMGNEYDFGVTNGVYSELNQSTTGYTLSNAGNPQEVYKTGNFNYDFDINGKLVSIKDPNNNIQQITYNIDGNPELVTDLSSNKTISFTYGENNKVSKVIENGGFSIRELSYNADNQVTLIQTKDNLDNVIRSIDFTYDTEKRISSITRDSNPETTATITYDSNGQVNVTYPTDQTEYTYLDLNSTTGVAYKTEIPNVNGQSSVLSYDIDGNLLKAEYPAYNGATENLVFTYTYDSNRNVLTESNGVTTLSYTYDELGQVTRVEDNLARFSSYTYVNRNLATISDNLGLLSTFSYENINLPNAVTGITDVENNTWGFTRNQFGQVAKITPPENSPTGETNFTYEEDAQSAEYGWLRSITNGAGDLVTINSYTTLGDATSITANPNDTVSRTTQYAYDATQRVTKVTQADGKELNISYTGPNPSLVVDEAGTMKQYGYCAECGKLTSASGPLNWALSWVLDEDKDVASFQDAMTNSTEYSYGNSKELKQITYPDNQKENFSYDNFGRLVERNNDASQLRQMTYDGSGWMTLYDAGDEKFSIEYNDDGTVSKEVDLNNNSRKRYVYNSRRLLQREVYNYRPLGANENQRFVYRYNTDGTMRKKILKELDQVIFTWIYRYDAAGRLRKIITSTPLQEAAQIEPDTIRFIYDGESRIKRQVNSNGTRVKYFYNLDRGWPIRIAYFKDNVKTHQYKLEYDNGLDTIGNITKVIELNGSIINYTYDELYRLTSEVRTGTNPYSRTYSYDLTGNVLTKNGISFAEYDVANKLTSLEGQAVSHDQAGDVTNLLGNNFSWTNRAKLKSAGSLISNVDYTYSFDGLMIKSNDELHYRTESSIGLTQHTTDNSIRTLYTYGPTGLVATHKLQELLPPQTSWYQFGPQGEARELTSNIGEVTDTYLYTAYGEELSSTGNTSNPHRYGAKFGYYTDSTTDLIIAGQRWYAPQTLRWLSRDPIHYSGGVNLYQYVEGNPVKYVDPSGNSPVINLSPRPVVVSGNPGMFTGSGSQIEFPLQPGQTCSFFSPINGVRDVDAVDTNGDNNADIRDEKIDGTSISNSKNPLNFGPVFIQCKPGSLAPGCEIEVVDKPPLF